MALRAETPAVSRYHYHERFLAIRERENASARCGQQSRSIAQIAGLIAVIQHTAKPIALQPAKLAHGVMLAQSRDYI